MYNILICDDEKDIVNALKIYLTNENYTFFEAYNGKEALDIVGNNTIHLALMDIMMPEMDGISSMVEIRKTHNIPIILLTAKSEDSDMILGLSIGADDYITKPFNPAEVVARVKSQLRRYTQLGGSLLSPKYCIGGIELDDNAKEVRVDGEIILFTPKEYEILKLLMQNPNKVFSPRSIYVAIWHEEPFGIENNIAVHIRHIREKIEIDPANPRYLKVVFGQGYKFEKGARS